MSNEIKKQIIVEYCDTCPFYGTCKAWKKLTKKQRVYLTISNGVGRFILKDCHLDTIDQPEPVPTEHIKALRDIRFVIVNQDDPDCLGSVPDKETQGYYIRDEVVDNLSKVINALTFPDKAN